MSSEFQFGLTKHQLLVGDLQREFLAYVPANWQRSGPLVLVLHGAGSCAEAMVDFCGLNATADKCGFAVLYPNGSGRVPQARSWNAGAANVWAARNNIDDVRFIHALLDHAADQLSVDERRVYVTGMSNGGLLCFLLGCEMPERLAAIAPVAVSLIDLNRRPTLPMPLVHLHGTADDFVRYEGGLGRKSLTNTSFVPVEDAIRFWAMANRCRELVTTDLPPLMEDGTRVTRHQHLGGDASVVLYQIHGAGHTWPGQPCGYAFLGPVTQNLSANETIWHFFRSNQR
jgi:polyhydroxybutyrate depolymerase